MYLSIFTILLTLCQIINPSQSQDSNMEWAVTSVKINQGANSQLQSNCIRSTIEFCGNSISNMHMNPTPCFDYLVPLLPMADITKLSQTSSENPQCPRFWAIKIMLTDINNNNHVGSLYTNFPPTNEFEQINTIWFDIVVDYATNRIDCDISYHYKPEENDVEQIPKDNV